MYVCMYVCISLSLYIYIYIYICIHLHIKYERGQLEHIRSEVGDGGIAPTNKRVTG